MIDEKINWTTESHLLNDLGHDDQEAFEAEVEELTNRRMNPPTEGITEPNKKGSHPSKSD
mgnify:CR=1 FL=1